MKNYCTQLFVFVLLASLFTGCDMIGDIFEAGVWAGVIIVVLVIVLIIWLIKKLMD
jgi:cytosine/uracil/thiamine/allantoin permease